MPFIGMMLRIRDICMMMDLFAQLGVISSARLRRLNS